MMAYASKPTALLAILRLFLFLFGSSCSGSSDLIRKPSLAFETTPEDEVVAKAGDRVTLTCSVSASPPATVVWLRNGRPIEPELGDGNDVEKEANTGLETLQLSDTASMFTVDCLDESSAGVYTCSASNGHLKAEANSTIKIAPHKPTNSGTPFFGFWKKKKNGGDACSIKKRESGRPAKIVMWTSSRMERVGAAVQLFCRASGSPKPTVVWSVLVGEAEKEVSLDHSTDMPFNYEVLDNGDLLMSEREDSSDEGNYSFVCRASNEYGKDHKVVWYFGIFMDK